MNSKSFYLVIGLMMSSSLLVLPAAQAEVVNNGQWLVRSGDSLYSIARKLFPGDAKQQARVRREIVRLNNEVFNGNANLMSVGSRLMLPDFAVDQKKPVAKPAMKKPAPPLPAPTMIVKTPAPRPALAQPAANGADPQDIIGRVLVNVGDVQAVNRGTVRNLTRHSDIYEGDTLRTSKQTYTQLRMKDGALISLRPETEMRLAEYTYNGQQDGSERSILELVRGGFRTITGAIGHKNKNNYQVRTTIATIGIRGTHYGLMLCDAGSCLNDTNLGNLQDGLYGGVVDGEIVTENQQGIFTFSNDEYFALNSASAIPQRTLVPPPIFEGDSFTPTTGDNQPPPSVADNLQQQANTDQQRRPQRLLAYMPQLRDNERLIPPPTNPDGELTRFEQPLPPKAPNGSGLALAFNHGGTGVGAPVYVTTNNGNNIFLQDAMVNGNLVSNLPVAVYEQSLDPQGNLQQHSATRVPPDGTTPASYVALGGNAALGVNWGRWSGNFQVYENGALLSHDGNLHYIYSPNLTTLTALTNLGGIRSKIQLYRYIGGTMPTNNLGQVATLAPTINADIDFVNHQMLSYSVDANVGGVNWYGASSGPVDFVDLGHGFSISGSCHSLICNGEASLMFVGTDAGGAMTSYSLSDTVGNGISGTGLLTPLNFATLPDNTGLLLGFHGTLATEAYPVLINTNSVDNVYVNGAGDPIIAEDRFTDANGVDHFRRVSVPSTASLTNQGIDSHSVPGNTVSWGRWDSANFIKEQGGETIADVMFIQSNNLTTPTQLGGLTGTATFNTVPGGFNGFVSGSAATGGSVTMDVDFSAGRVTNYVANASFSVNTLEGRAGNIPFQQLSRGFALSSSSGCLNGGCTGSAAVAFVGANAQGAISSFSMRDAVANVASGTALMTRP